MKKILNKIIYFIKIKILEKSTLKIIKKNKEKVKFFLFCTPIHGNLGDHAITYAEQKFFLDNFPNCVVIEIPTDLIEKKGFLDKLKMVITDKDIIFINGGGFLGDLWLNEEYAVRKVIGKFKKSPIIILPQTIFYHDTKSENIELQRSVKVYANNPNVILCARDKNSYSFMKKNYLQNKVLFIPDMVLYLNKVNNDFDRNNVTFFFRKDKEKSVYDEEIQMLISKLESIQEKIVFRDTVISRSVSIKRRKKELDSILKDYYKSKIIITDRLHGMIFAAITGTPCIAFDNLSKKVSGVYEWIKSLDYIYLCNQEENPVELLKTIYKKQGLRYQFDLKLSFQQLEELINYYIGGKKNG